MTNNLSEIMTEKGEQEEEALEEIQKNETLEEEKEEVPLHVRNVPEACA